MGDCIQTALTEIFLSRGTGTADNSTLQERDLLDQSEALVADQMSPSRLSRNGSKSKKKVPILPDITFLIITGPGWQPELFGRCYRNVCNIRLQQKYRPAWCSPICNAGADQFLFWLHRGLTTEDIFYVQT